MALLAGYALLLYWGYSGIVELIQTVSDFGRLGGG